MPHPFPPNLRGGGDPDAEPEVTDPRALAALIPVHPEPTECEPFCAGSRGPCSKCRRNYR